MRRGISTAQVKTAAHEASSSVEEQQHEGEGGKRSLTIQSNEFAHGLQNVAYKLNKAAQNLKAHSKPIEEVAQRITHAAHGILESLHNFHASDLKKKVKSSLDDIENHISVLIDIDSNQEGGSTHIKNAVQALLKTVIKLEINAKFLGKSKEDIKTEIDVAVKRIKEAIEKITEDNEKTVKDLTEQLQKLSLAIGIIIDDINDFISTNPEDPELLKLLKEVSKNLATYRNEVSTALEHPSGLAVLKQALSSNVGKVADEIKKLVVVKEDDEGNEEARHLDKIAKTVLIEGLTVAKNLAGNLEAIGQHEQ